MNILKMLLLKKGATRCLPGKVFARRKSLFMGLLLHHRLVVFVHFYFVALYVSLHHLPLLSVRLAIGLEHDVLLVVVHTLLLHLQIELERARDVKSGVTLLLGALQTTTTLLLADAAHKLPTTGANLIQVDDRLHFFGVAEAHLGYPESAANVRPVAKVLGGLHGAAHHRTQHALGLERATAERARHAQPIAGRYFGDAVAGLVHADVAAVAEDHLVGVLRVGHVTHIAHDALVVLDAVAFEFASGALKVLVRLLLEVLDETLKRFFLMNDLLRIF